jgi:hypothetical protein
MQDTDRPDDRIDVGLLAEIAAGVEQAFVDRATSTP